MIGGMSYVVNQLTGSILFNGTSQYLTAPSSSALQGLASGNMTIEFWIYFNSAWGTNLYNPIQKGRTGTSDYEWGVYLTGAGGNAGVISWQPNNGTGINTIVSNSSSVTILPSQWYHIAISVSGTTVYFFLNGVAVGTAAVTLQSFVGSGALSVTNNNNGTNTYFPGYMSNIRIVKGVAVYTSAFTPPTNPLTATQSANFNGNPSAAITGTSTSLLMNTTNNANFLVDSSSFNTTITNNGSATSALLNPYGVGSVLFNGTSQFLSATLSAALGTGAYTIECWINSNSLYNGKSYSGIFDSRTSGTDAGGVSLYFQASGTSLVYRIGATNAITIDASVLSPNTWYHMAVSKKGSLVTLYINGVSVGTATNSANSSNTLFNIGKTFDPFYFNGYISNFRITAGIPVYPSNPTFTPPTGTLPALRNTQLLLDAQISSTYITDTSNNNFTLTPTGTVSYYPGSYFTTGGALTLNGTTQYLSLVSTPFLFSSGDFTIESWVYPTSYRTGAGATSIVIDNWVSFSPYLVGQWQFGVGSSGQVYFVYTPTTTTYTTIGTGTAPLNTWTHIAAVRSSGTITIYVNGVASGSLSVATNIGVVGSVGSSVGAQTTNATLGTRGYWFAGYITNARTVIGTAVYTSNFTVPTSPLTAISGTSLLLSVASSAGYITDSSTNNYTVTNVNAVTYNFSTPVFNNGAMFFNSSVASYLTTPSTNVFNLTGDFTIEAWINPTSLASGSNGILDARVAGSTSAPWAVYVDSTGQLTFYTGTAYAGGSPITAGVWTHVAVVRTATTLTLYINGNAGYISTAFGNGAISPGVTSALIGTKDYIISTQYKTIEYITNLRFINGTALYTGNFTPPAGVFTATQGSNQNGIPSAAITGTQTSLLLNTPNGPAFTTDTSTYALAVTNTGAATSQSLNPWSL